jgi:type II secretory pathway pseudopilin PulG
MCDVERAATRGFTYVWVLLMVAVMGAGLAAAAQVWTTFAQRERERELLFIGTQFQRAIASYYEATPGTVKRFPRTFDELLEDKRFPVVRRHLRRVYPDPMTGKAQWGLIQAPDGQIVGVHSLSRIAPLKIDGFAAEHAAFARAASIAEWRFTYSPGVTASAPAIPGPVQGNRPPINETSLEPTKAPDPAPLDPPAGSAPRIVPQQSANPTTIATCETDRIAYVAQCIARVKGKPALERACETGSRTRASQCERSYGQ